MPDPSSLAALDHHIDRRSDAMVSLLTELVSYRTDSQTQGDTDFVEQARSSQTCLSEELRKLDADVQCLQVSNNYPAVLAHLKGRGGGRTLALNGHFDVVPSGDAASWASDPWTVTFRDRRLYGRGVTDMKSGIVAQISALRALKELGMELCGDVWLHYVSDEEVVGQSTRRLIGLTPRLDGVVDSEPTGLAIMPVEGGLVHLRVEVEGQESHAGNRYTTLYPGPAPRGVNAIEKAVKILEALRSLEHDWAKKTQHPLLAPGFNTIMPGLFFGGPGGGHDGRLNIVSNAGTTPNYASIEFNIWYLPDESFEEIRDEIEDYLDCVCALDPWLRLRPPRLTWKLNGVFYPPCATPLAHPIVRVLEQSMADLGLPSDIGAFPAASELAWYSEAGIGGALFGPGVVEQAHAPDESVELSQLVAAVRCLSRAIWAFCGDLKPAG
jgi:acetylornithine deacetylase